MIEKIYLGLVLIFFVLAFAVRNLKTYFDTKESIKGKSLKLSISIFISTFIYIFIFLRLVILQPSWILEIENSTISNLKYIGIGLVTIGFALGILALIAMRNSWRVGIKYDQKTELVSSGIYRFSRNPYFFSYSVLICGYLLIFPSLILFILWVLLGVTFHKMILEEEIYLESVHGEHYLNYKNKVNRYITFR